MPKVVSVASNFSPALLKHRANLRKMMQTRCAVPNSPIPPALANRVADWILMLVSYRANERRKAGGEAFPDAETLAEDISRAAEGIELLFVVMHEEATEKVPLVIAQQVQ